MIKQLARWILKNELKIKDEIYLNQIELLKNDYEKRLIEIDKKIKKQTELFIGSRK